MMSEVGPDIGKVEWGYETHPGYVAQDHKAQIGSANQRLEDWLAAFCPDQGIGFVKGNLAAVLFTGEESKNIVAGTVKYKIYGEVAFCARRRAAA